MSLRWLLLIAAVVFLCFAAFKLTWGTDTVIWLYLGLACWAASFAADDSPIGKRRN